jgi:hypothetical protein
VNGAKRACVPGLHPQGVLCARSQVHQRYLRLAAHRAVVEMLLLSLRHPVVLLLLLLLLLRRGLCKLLALLSAGFVAWHTCKWKAVSAHGAVAVKAGTSSCLIHITPACCMWGTRQLPMDVVGGIPLEGWEISAIRWKNVLQCPRRQPQQKRWAHVSTTGLWSTSKQMGHW